MDATLPILILTIPLGMFLLLGIVMLGASLIVADVFWSSLLGVTAFSSFWSILEIFEQRQRVRKGWFPRNPRRNDY